MGTHKKVAAATIAAALVLGGAACGSGSDAADRIAEELVENETGGDIDLNSEDGSVKFTDDEGNESEIDVTGDGASLPDDWPEALAPPDSVKIITAATNTVNGAATMTVLGEAEGTVEDFLPAITSQIESAGFEITQNTSTEVTGGSYAGLSAESADQELVVAIAEDTTSEGKVSITMTLAAKA
jgi:hypothetical protein